MGEFDEVVAARAPLPAVLLRQCKYIFVRLGRTGEAWMGGSLATATGDLRASRATDGRCMRGLCAKKGGASSAMTVNAVRSAILSRLLKEQRGELDGKITPDAFKVEFPLAAAWREKLFVPRDSLV